MTPEDFAKMLHGREYGSEMTVSEESLAASEGLVVVFGYSDDNCEFRGAIHDEIGAGDRTEIRFDKSGIPNCKCGDMDCPYFAEQRAALPGCLVAVWNDAGAPAWSYQTDIPHATFDVVEDGEVYCRGVVFRLSDVGVNP